MTLSVFPLHLEKTGWENECHPPPSYPQKGQWKWLKVCFLFVFFILKKEQWASAPMLGDSMFSFQESRPAVLQEPCYDRDGTGGPLTKTCTSP